MKKIRVFSVFRGQYLFLLSFKAAHEYVHLLQCVFDDLVIPDVFSDRYDQSHFSQSISDNEDAIYSDSLQSRTQWIDKDISLRINLACDPVQGYELYCLPGRSVNP